MLCIVLKLLGIGLTKGRTSQHILFNTWRSILQSEDPGTLAIKSNTLPAPSRLEIDDLAGFHLTLSQGMPKMFAEGALSALGAVLFC